MSYTKTVSVNNQAPAINADNLNKIEDGIYNSVRYADAQNLTATQKAQAMKNIGAATVDHNHYGRIIEPTSVELYPGKNAGHGGYIDFHYNSDSADYTSRIIEAPSGNVTLNGMGIMTRANITAVWNVGVDFKNGIAEYSNTAIKANRPCFAQFRSSSVGSSFQDTALAVHIPSNGKLTIVAKNGATFSTHLNILILNL